MRSPSCSSRRNFLRNSVAAGLTAGLCDSIPAPLLAADPQHSRVSIARDPLLRGPESHPVSISVDERRILALLDHAMQGLFESADAAHVWSRIVQPGQTVGIKVNTLGGRGLSTSVPLVDAICERLQGAGIRPQDITIWDRDTNELERAGFRIRTGGSQVQCYGTDRAGFERDLATWGSVGSQLSQLLTRRSAGLINVPVLKDHDGAGVSIALKNMYGVVHNPNKYHPNGCDPYVADVNMLPEIRSRLRLHICDATSACYHGGPAFKPEFTWQPNALAISADPVALDYTCWQIIERKRAEKGLKTLTAEERPPRYIATAADADHRLGTNDPHRIQLVDSRVS